MTRFGVLICAVAAFGLVLGSHAVLADDVLAVYDDFDDGVLGGEWSAGFVRCLGWTYAESNTSLQVSDVVPTRYRNPSTESWVVLTQQFPPLDDFAATFAISWTSDLDDKAAQFVELDLKGENGESIVGGGYADGWVGASGSKLSRLAGVEANSGQGTLPYLGSGLVSMTRTNGQVEVLWDGVSIRSGTVTGLVTQAQIGFLFLAYEGPSGTSIFGSESVDLVSIEGVTTSAVPPTCDNLLAACVDELNAANAAIAGLQASVSNANQAVAALQGDLTAANAIVAGLTNELAVANQTIAVLHANLTAADQTIAGLQADLANANQTISGLQSNLAAANATIAGLQNDLAAASATITQLQTENATLKNTIQRQADQNQQLWGLIMWLAGIIWG